jgi:transposase
MEMRKDSMLSTNKRNKIISGFAEYLTATATANIVRVTRNTINTYYKEFRNKILKSCMEESRVDRGEFELDESYFGAKRVRGKRGRGVAFSLKNRFC